MFCKSTQKRKAVAVCTLSSLFCGRKATEWVIVMQKYEYRPVKFFALALAFTWFFWILAIVINSEEYSTVLMLFGLLAPAVIATVMILGSNNKELKSDFVKRIVDFSRLNIPNLLMAVILFFVSVAVAIVISTFFGQSFDQFSFVEDFSFSGPGIMSALLTVLLASVIEEFGWRGYAQDAVAQYFTWFKTSLVFGVFWALWHLPLLWVQGTYHSGLMELGLPYVLNFFVCTIPMAFMANWVYYKNNRSITAGVLYHLFLNFMQEKIAMTPFTKCIETVVIVVVAIIVVYVNRKMFFEKDHIGKMPC